MCVCGCEGACVCVWCTNINRPSLGKDLVLLCANLWKPLGQDPSILIVAPRWRPGHLCTYVRTLARSPLLSAPATLPASGLWWRNNWISLLLIYSPSALHCTATFAPPRQLLLGLGFLDLVSDLQLQGLRLTLTFVSFSKCFK